MALKSNDFEIRFGILISNDLNLWKIKKKKKNADISNSFQTSVEGTRAFQGCLKPIFQSDAKFQTDKFALDLALKQWQNATLKWPIRVCFTSLCDWLKLAPSSGNQSEVKLTIAICDSVARTRFPAIGASSILYLIRVLIVSLCCLHLI